MTAICLVRHGQTEWNRLGKIQGKTNIPLNETGKAQAKQCAVLLDNLEWDMIITSPLMRARQTADIMNEHAQLPIIEMDAFKERDFGDAEGMTPEDREAMFSNREYPNMETREALILRIEIGLKHIVETYPGRRILLVAHGGVINTILAVLSAGEIGSGKTTLANACFSNIYFEADNWHIKDFNQIAHLT